MKGLKTFATSLCAAALFTCAGFTAQAEAADLNVGVIDVQSALATSKAGKRAKGVMEQKLKSYNASFKKDEDALRALSDEISKKGSAWSDSVKQEKIATFQKQRTALEEKRRTASQEMRRLDEQHMQPVLKKLEEVIQQVAKSGNYDLVLPRNAVLFASAPYDITPKVVSAMNAAMP